MFSTVRALRRSDWRSVGQSRRGIRAARPLAMPNTADLLVDSLVDWGVEVVFGLPGDGINGVVEALRKRQKDIRFARVRHEEALMNGWQLNKRLKPGFRALFHGPPGTGKTLTATLLPPGRRGEGLGLLGVVSGVPAVVPRPTGVFLAGHHLAAAAINWAVHTRSIWCTRSTPGRAGNIRSRK